MANAHAIASDDASPAPTKAESLSALTLESPRVRESINAITDALTEVSCSATSLRATIDALEEELLGIDNKRHPRVWGLMEATISGLLRLENVVAGSEVARDFIDMRVLR